MLEQHIQFSTGSKVTQLQKKDHWLIEPIAKQEQAYANWRDVKLVDYPTSIDSLMVEIEDFANPSVSEVSTLRSICRKTNFVLYKCRNPKTDKVSVHQFGVAMGLHRLDTHLCADEDGIASLTDDPSGQRQEYIPYSNKAINWHTDGYYNDSAHRIRGVILHCVHPASSGGENQLLDHEIVYILLRDRNPDYVRALMHPEAMTIPANVQDGVVIRELQTGPVFYLDSESNRLYMRYTARTRSIQWRDDAVTREAVACLEAILQTPSAYHFQYCLQAGEGLLANNILHTRSAFVDQAPEQKRLLYRARYYDSIQLGN